MTLEGNSAEKWSVAGWLIHHFAVQRYPAPLFLQAIDLTAIGNRDERIKPP
jgi:hypothetical protein